MLMKLCGQDLDHRLLIICNVNQNVAYEVLCLMLQSVPAILFSAMTAPQNVSKEVELWVIHHNIHTIEFTIICWHVDCYLLLKIHLYIDYFQLIILNPNAVYST